MTLAIGEILTDQFPGYKREGGAPFNFAFRLKHLGLPVRLITRIGDDANGQGLQRMLYRHGFELSDKSAKCLEQSLKMPGFMTPERLDLENIYDQ